MKRYDFVLAGGGLAGLSLALHLMHSPLRECSLLVVDRDAKQRNDRTWCFWTRRPTLFDEIVCREWDRLRVASGSGDIAIALGDYRYKLIRGIDLYRFACRQLSAYPHVEFLQGSVEAITDDPEGATVQVDGQSYQARWVFDSRFSFDRFPGLRHELRQHFKGWLVETPREAFDPGTATLMDFRTPQHAELRFFYVLPLSPRQALVEFVALSPDRYGDLLQAYLKTVLGVTDYRVVASEGGVNPLSALPFPRRAGAHVMNIGTRGGRVKPSSGYAFMRIQRDSAAIVDSLTRSGTPFDVPAGPACFRLCDALLLDIMRRRGDRLAPILTALFTHNPIGRVFRFLDETASPVDSVRLAATLPPRPFWEALVRLALKRRAPARSRSRLRARMEFGADEGEPLP